MAPIDTPPAAGFTVSGMLLGLLANLTLMAVGTILLVWMERKVSARIQARLGPTRVGWHGLMQTVADMLKLLLKEILTPAGADRAVYYLAPILPITASCLCLAVIPWDWNLQVTDLNVGALYLIGISTIGVFGVLMAGWASNNKFSLLGALRAGAQMVSYEISFGLNMLLIVLLAGTASLRGIVLSQQGTVLDWWIFKLPVLGFVGFVMYLISTVAELNRGPFDIAEAEQEITAGFHTEYSGMAFAVFFMAEFVNMMIAAFVGATLYLGGFLAPQFGLGPVDHVLAAIPGVIWLTLKAIFIIYLYMIFRWTFARPRIDQLLALEWKVLLPINFILLAAAGLFVFQGWIL